MPRPLSFGKLSVDLKLGQSTDPAIPDPETPWQVAILGDFRSSSRRAGAGLVDRRPLRVDRDNLNAVLAKLGVELQLSTAGEDGPRTVIRFAELDDFHPDRLFPRLEVFQALRGLRARLSNPTTFPAAAEEMRGWGAAAPSPPQTTPAPTPENAAGLLDQILGETPAPQWPAEGASPAGEVQTFLKRLVAPHLVRPIDYSRQAQLLALVDDVTGKQMRAILHHPDYQALESAWRAVFFLVRRLETGPNLQLYLLDVSRDELAADLSVDDLCSTATYRLLVKQPAGGQPWALVVGNYTFGEAVEDVELLGRLAKIARQAEAPFLAAASGRLLGCESLARTPDPDDWQPPDPDLGKAWEALQRLPEASAVGLALPRFLLRLPYGKESRPTEQFAFEELAEDSGHERYLWGNPAFACAYLLAGAFRRRGWDIGRDIPTEIDDLPLHTYEEDGESRVKPCAEVCLTDRAARAIWDRGLMPLLSVRQQDTVYLAGFRSVADPATALAGRWH